MPGQPVLEEVERKLREELGGEEWVFDQLAEGRTVGQVAEDLGISRRYLYRWRDRIAHKERRRALWKEAMQMSGAAQAERGLQELETVDRDESGAHRIPMSAEVQLAGSRAKYRQWLAGKLDPETYGDKGLEMSFSFGDLHLQALQRPRELPAAVVEGEWEEEGDSTDDVDGVAQAPEPSALPASPDPEPRVEAPETSDDELADLFR